MKGSLIAALASVFAAGTAVDTPPEIARPQAVTLHPEPNPEPESRDMSTLQDVAKRLIDYRRREGCAAEVVVKMALKIGYESGADTGYAAGYRAGVSAWTGTPDVSTSEETTTEKTQTA